MGDAPRLTDERLAGVLRRGLTGKRHASVEITEGMLESIITELQERRAQSEGQAKVVEARRQAIEECAKVCEQKLLVFDGCGDVKIGVEMAGKLLVHAIRALTPIGDSSGEGGGR